MIGRALQGDTLCHWKPDCASYATILLVITPPKKKFALSVQRIQEMNRGI